MTEIKCLTVGTRHNDKGKMVSTLDIYTAITSKRGKIIWQYTDTLIWYNTHNTFGYVDLAKKKAQQFGILFFPPHTIKNGVEVGPSINTHILGGT